MSDRDIPPEQTASRYAAQLLQQLGFGDAPVDAPPMHPALAAAWCGLTALTGDADGSPHPCPAALAYAADGALAALASIAPADAFTGLRGSALLTERAALFGHARHGRSSAGGSCRLLDTRDGAVALNLARDDDWSLLPALFERAIDADWQQVTQAVAQMTMHTLIERGRELGLAVAPVAPAPSMPPPWWRENAGRGSVQRAQPQSRRPRVLDLSSLWAGPLCAHLLQRCGADVVKLESTRRPDGARNGPLAFFDLMNAGKRSVAVDFATPLGRAQLRALIDRADIVIEASRPRALRQLGVDAEVLTRDRADLIWISLSGYGRSEPQAQWIAYGDDAGVAGGLSYLMRLVSGAPLFVGDAIADPLAGLHAALAAWARWRAGDGGLIDIALVDVVRHIVGFEAPADADGWRRRARDWSARLQPQDLRAPTARTAPQIAAALGADTATVFADWGVAC